MPKAGELHHHLSGAVYAETLIQLGTYQGDCLDTPSGTVVPCGDDGAGADALKSAIRADTPDCLACAGQTCDVQQQRRPLCCLCGQQSAYDDLVNAFSMRSVIPGTLEAHDHFFSIFGKFGDSQRDRGAIVAQLRHQAAREGVLYIETMLSVRGGDEALDKLVRDLSHDPDGPDLCQRLFAPAPVQLPAYSDWPADFQTAMGRVAQELVQETLERSDQLLDCGTAQADAGCGVTVRLMPELHRTRERDAICREALRAFAVAEAAPEIVGMNIVAAEDSYRSRIDYTAHMNLIGNLGLVFPSVGRALHAGELWEGLVPPNDLRFHMTEATALARAQRIGHGVSLAYEQDSLGLLLRLAGEGGPPVAIEINLVSNAQLLGVEGSQHPFPLYVESGVPTVLSTDDPGIMRTSLTDQFVRAAIHYPALDYDDFLRFNRNALEFSFAPGNSIWSDTGKGRRPIEPCAGPSGELDLGRCHDWARSRGGEKARLQVTLEERLSAFAARILGR